MGLIKVMVDPDVPSPSNPHQREYLHWFVSYLFISFNLTLDRASHLFSSINRKQIGKVYMGIRKRL